jgi:hypothetical protein
MPWSKIIKGALVVGAVVFVFMFAGKIWNYLFPVPPVIPGGTTVINTPAHTVTPGVQHQLPSGQHGTSQVDVPPVTPHPGMIPQQHVVVTDQGNTLVVTTEKLDWGFRLEPKVYLGMSDRVFIGLGANVFTVWRINTDVFIATNLDKDKLLSECYLGAGLSYQVYRNTFLGFNVLESTQLKTMAGVNLSLKF